MTMKILHAIKLWQTGSKTNPTPRQVAGLAKVSLQRVLEVLTLNSSLVKMEKGRIMEAWWEDTRQAYKNAMDSGLFWEEHEIDYDRTKGFKWKNNPEADKLKKPFYSGGIGDCLRTEELVVNSENEAKLRSLGMRSIKEINLRETKGYIVWRE